MSNGLIQYNSGEHSYAGQNITEAIHTDGDIVFNESYIVVGDSLRARKVHATYDLTVHGNIVADEVIVNGTLLVTGDIDVSKLHCHGKFICTGEVKVVELIADGFTTVDSLSGDQVYTSNDMFIHTTIDTNKALQSSGVVVAAEGIMGAGAFSAKAAIANEYFDFSGEPTGKVFEISTMDFIGSGISVAAPVVPDPAPATEELDLGDIILLFKDAFEADTAAWSDLDEDELVNTLFKIAGELPDLSSIRRIVDRIVEISYLTKITNLEDYLYIVWAKEVFPEALMKYDTLEGVFGQLYEDAHRNASTLNFAATTIKGVSDGLYVLSNYHRKLSISFEECADKIFSSIGLRYTTVKHALEVHQ